MRRFPHRLALLLCSLCPIAPSLFGQRHASSSPASIAHGVAQPRWIASWGSSQTAPYGTETLPAGAMDNATVRETVHLSAGGSRIRLHLSNAFGERPLVLRDVTIALPAPGRPSGAVQPGSVRRVLFDREASATVQLGSEYVSDPLDFPVAAGSDLVVSLAVGSAPTTLTLHAGAHATGFLLPGDHAADAQLPSAATNTRWYFLAGVEVEAPGNAITLVTLGDSITDGHGSTTDGNDRWPDNLARRLGAAMPANSVGVVNAGIGGNCLLQVCVGPAGLARFDRDVLAVPSVHTVIVMEGINDLGGLSRLEPQPASVHADLLQRLEAGLLQMVARVHAHGIRAVGATLTPWAGSGYYHPDAAAEADRVALNQWIRNSGSFDAVVDFDAALRDPGHPEQMLSAYDSGDHLHPGPAGYRRMVEAMDLHALVGIR